MTRVAPGVWAAEVRSNPAAYAFAGSLVVLGDRGVLVVDTQQSPRAAGSLIEWIRARTEVPVRWVVNTHGHGDHVYGNGAYRRAFPGVSVLAHRATAAFMAGEGRDALAAERERLPGTIEDRERWLATGRGPSGRELDGEDRAAVRRSLELRTAYLEVLEGVELTPPEITFRDRVSIELGGRRVEVVHVGPAHTAGDVVVHLPDDGIVAVGDLVEEGTPWIEGARIVGWARALERVAAFQPEHVLPSHGRLQGPGLLEAQARLFEAVVDAARAATEEGWDAETAVRRRGLMEHGEALGAPEADQDAVRAFLVQAVSRAMEEVGPRRSPG
jgi:cyclase